MSSLTNIQNTYESYQKLISLYENHKDEFFSDIHIEIRQFFTANLSAALGAVLDKFKSELNNVHFTLDRAVEVILQKNDFLSYFGKPRAMDTYRTTIKYQKLKPTDGKHFKRYVIEELIEGHISDLPTMSAGVKEKMVEGIYEIFVNAQIHSESSFIYTCGQFFPKRNTIEFTIVDTGVGFREKVNRRFNSNLRATQAIEWAIQDKKTTKEGVSGGIGLAVLREFIGMNKGTMQIVSSDGFYEYGEKGETLREFKGEFPGTIVNLEFNTDDKNNYSLTSEINTDDIF